MLRLFLIVISLFGIWLAAPANQLDQLRFKRLQMETGLSNNTVLCIQQDQKGFMWFGTIDGLNRYDGYSFKVFKNTRENPLTISSNQINSLFNDSQNRLWIGTENGLNLYDHNSETFEYFAPSYSDGQAIDLYIKCMLEDDRGNLWIGTSTGLYQFDVAGRKYVIQDQTKKNPCQVAEDNILNIVPDPKGFWWLCTLEGLKIFQTGETLPADQLKEQTFFRQPLQIRTVFKDQSGAYWLGTESDKESLFYFDENLDLATHTLKSGEDAIFPNDKIRVITPISNGEIWFGSLSGLFIYEKDQNKFRKFTHNKNDIHSLSHNSVRDIYEDKDGGIWVATYRGGINYFHPSKELFQLVQEEPWRENSLSHDVVTSILEDANHNLWVGTENGLNYYDFEKKKYTHFYQNPTKEGLLNNVIKSLALDKQGNLWIGSLSGLSRYEPQNRQFSHFIYDPDDHTSISIGHAQEILIDSNNQIWIGTNVGGLNLYLPKKKQFQKFYEPDSIPSFFLIKEINALAEGSDGLIWIGTPRGLFAINQNDYKFKRPRLFNTHQKDLLDTRIFSLHYSLSNILWAGTENRGLVYYDTGSGEVFAINEKKGLSNNTIQAILEDKYGNIWVSSNRGISKITRPDEGWKSTANHEIANFDVSDGLQGFQYYNNSALHKSDGRFYFGGIKGYNTFFPEEIQETVLLPKVIFTGLRVWKKKSFNKPSEEAADLTINSQSNISIINNQSDFSISFSALNYKNPAKTIYAYKLEPLDKEWNNLDDQRIVNFKKLPAGSYIFKVRATNKPGAWEETFSQLKFEILPSWWNSWPAMAGYVLLAMALLLTFFKLATRWERLKTELRLEHLEREKELELHQHKIRFFTNLSHELKAPLTLIMAPLSKLRKQSESNIRIKNQLTMIQRNGERMLNLINQMLDIRKIETGHTKLYAAKGNIVKFLREVSLSFREMAIIHKIDFYFNASEDVIDVFFDRDKMEVVMYNLLSNAFKFTPSGGQISVMVSRDHPKEIESNRADNPVLSQAQNEWVVITVQDNGRGIPIDIQQQIFKRFFSSSSGDDLKSNQLGTGIGLDLAKKYIDLHYGKIDVYSVPTREEVPGYTRFSIQLPLGKSHLKETDIIQGFKDSEDISLYQDSRFIKDPLLEGPLVAGQTQPESLLLEREHSILIVEDNDEVRSFLCTLFEKEFVVYGAVNGQEGIEKAFELIPDIIISDIMMPLTDGMELCRTLKSDIRTSHIPIILLTARTAISFRFEGLETGADDYITKPFSSEHLQLRVRNLIQQREWIRQHFSGEQKLLPEKITLTSVDERLLRATINYIRKNISESDLTVEKLSREVGLSRVHLYRKLKALTTLSPKEFIRNVRLECAAEILKSNKLNVSEVRYMVGMPDPDYFRKCFKEKYGSTPSDYVKTETMKSNETRNL